MSATQALQSQNPPIATPLVSIEEYLNTRYRPDRDFVDGHLEERRPDESYNFTAEEEETLLAGEYEHNKLQLLIGSWFVQHDSSWNVSAVTEQRIHASSERVRVCDVCVLRGEDSPYDKVIQKPPLLCIEILSPLDRLSRARIVLEDYRLMGVPYIWLIDPIRKLTWTYDADGLHEASPDRLEIPGSPIHLLLRDFFAIIERRRR